MIDQIHFNIRLMQNFMALEEQAVREHSWPIHTRIPFASADCVAHTHILPTLHGVTGGNPMQGVIITLGATSASVPPLRGGCNLCTVFAATKRVGHVQCPMPCTV